MMETKKYCLYCLQEKNELNDICEHCGQPCPENHSDQIRTGSYVHQRYLVGRCIGQGGFGVTYIGRDTVLDTRVAIKEYFPSDIAGRNEDGTVAVRSGNPENQAEFETGRARFLQEARMLAKFKNEPSIVGVWDIVTENNTVYIIMEYIDGVTLRQYVKQNGPMSFQAVYALLSPLMGALEKIHAEGLIHRDISPSNIMLMDGGGVKLLDFGAAREFMNEGAKSIVLKPGYSPEEQYRSLGQLGPYTDVYAFCATIYFALTGCVPDNAMTRVLDDHLQLPGMLGAEISEREEQVLMKGMAVLARDRIGSMSELQEAFRTGVSSFLYNTEDDDDEKTLAVTRTDTVDRGADASEMQIERRKARSERDLQPEDKKKEKRQPEKLCKQENERKLEKQHKREKEPKPEKQHKSNEKRETKTKHKNSRRSRKILGISIIAIAAVIGIIIYLLFGQGVVGADQYEKGSTSVAFRDEVITDKMIKSIRHSKEITSVHFSECEISDEQIETLTELDGQVNQISFASCTGYTTLDPLAEMTSLTNLQLSGINYDLTDNSGDYSLSGATVFTKDFSNLQYLSLHNFKFGGDMDFLSHFPNLKSLSLNGEEVSELDTLTCGDTMQTLHIYETDLSQMDLEFLSEYTHMTTLELEDCSCGDVSWMKDMSELTTINLSDNNLSSIPMLTATNLYSVNVSDNQLTDLNWLPAQENSSLSLYAGNNQISDISALEQAPGLFIFLASDNQISDISALADKSSLETLKLDDNQITNADPLSADTALETLDLSENQIGNLDFCENITTLTNLSAHHNAITDISGLINTTQLEEAILSDNQITDASVLEKSAAHLQTVILDNNQISDISMLKGAAELSIISVDHNRLTSLEGLESSEKLYAVSACGNELTDISALSGMTSLYLVDLGENQLTDISALSSVDVPKMALLVENNQISDISMLNVDCDYCYLSLYNNAIIDYSVLKGNQTIWEYDVLYASWDEKADLSGIGASKYENNINMVDVPLDQQQELINIFEDAKEEYQESTWTAEPTFLTTEEADQQINDDRQELREECGLSTDTEDEENTDE